MRSMSLDTRSILLTDKYVFMCIIQLWLNRKSVYQSIDHFHPRPQKHIFDAPHVASRKNNRKDLDRFWVG
jgi:hypothetical protein